jgi:transcription termination/antitermination protein NusG
MVSHSNDNPWMVLQVSANHELRVNSAVAIKGYETFVPTHLTVTRGKRGAVLAPLFPGYVFCRSTTRSTGLIVTTPGVLRIVSFGGHLASVDNAEIIKIRKMTMSGRECGPHAYLSVGERVVILNGPLNGVKGILVRAEKKSRLVISVDLLMRSIFAEVDKSDVMLSCAGPVAAESMSVSTPSETSDARSARTQGTGMAA